MAKREAILTNIVTTLETITVDNGYNNNIGLVTREPKDWVNLKPKDLPTACVQWSPDEREVKQIQGNNILSTLTIIIRGVVYAKTDIETEINKFTDDIEIAMMVDDKRGGNAMYTNPGTITVYQSLAQFYSTFDFKFEIKYQYMKGAP